MAIVPLEELKLYVVTGRKGRKDGTVAMPAELKVAIYGNRLITIQFRGLSMTKKNFFLHIAELEEMQRKLWELQNKKEKGTGEWENNRARLDCFQINKILSQIFTEARGGKLRDKFMA